MQGVLLLNQVPAGPLGVCAGEATSKPRRQRLTSGGDAAYRAIVLRAAWFPGSCLHYAKESPWSLAFLI